MENRFTGKRAYIFDVDGTLYSQRKMRCIMACQLLKHCLTRITNYKDLLMIFRFRRLREKDEYKTKSIADLAEWIAREENITADRVHAAIQTWMFDMPLSYLNGCAYHDILSFIRCEMKGGAVVSIYSDYPAREKLQVLDITPDHVFAAGESQIQELKPSRQMMRYILEEMAVPKEQILYIGDRDEKDGASARLEGIPYMDVQVFRKALKAMAKTERGTGA